MKSFTLKNKSIKMFHKVFVFTLGVMYILRINTNLIPFVSAFNKLYQFVSIISIFLSLWNIWQSRKLLTFIDKLLVIFFFYTCFSTLINQHTFSRMSITLLVDTANLIFVFYFFTRLADGNRILDKLFVVFYILFSIQAIIAVFVYFSNVSITLPNGYTIVQTDRYLENILVQKNQGAINSLLCILLSIYFFKKSVNKGLKFLFIFMPILFSLVIFLADARGTMVILLFDIVLLFMMKMKRIGKKKLFILTVGFIVVILSVAMARGVLFSGRSITDALSKVDGQNDLFERVIQFMNFFTTGRSVMWQLCISLTTGWHIFLGNGIYSFLQLQQEVLNVQWFENPHCILFDMYFKTGLVGLALFLTVGGVTVWKIFKSRIWQFGDEKVLLCLFIFVSVAVFALLDCGIVFLQKWYNVMFWLSFGALVKQYEFLKKKTAPLDLKNGE